MSREPGGAYGAGDHIVDYILGITFEIWEQKGLDLIHRYYGADAPVYALSGVVRGAAQVVEGTRQTLRAFPDRILIGDGVIWSGNGEDGYYTSHRIVSTMTHTGPSQFGPATGRRLRILSIADCVVENGVITREWLMRDHDALARQLGMDVAHVARVVADARDTATLEWIDAQRQRVDRHGVAPPAGRLPRPQDDAGAFARAVVTALWSGNARSVLDDAYAPYASLQRCAQRLYSGRDAIDTHYAGLRAAIAATGVCVDHVAVQPFADNGLDIAVRWTVAGHHDGEFEGHGATGKPVFVLGASHWRVIGGRIVAEWTVFDGAGVIAQFL